VQRGAVLAGWLAGWLAAAWLLTHAQLCRKLRSLLYRSIRHHEDLGAHFRDVCCHKSMHAAH
jgi:hypothetical protein